MHMFVVDGSQLEGSEAQSFTVPQPVAEMFIVRGWTLVSGSSAGAAVVVVVATFVVWLELIIEWVTLGVVEGKWVVFVIIVAWVTVEGIRVAVVFDVEWVAFELVLVGAAVVLCPSPKVPTNIKLSPTRRKTGM